MVDTQLIAHDKEVYDIAWGGVGVFASVSADGSVRVFDLRSAIICIACGCIAWQLMLYVWGVASQEALCERCEAALLRNTSIPLRYACLRRDLFCCQS